MWIILPIIFFVIIALIFLFLFIYSNPLKAKWYITLSTSLGLFLSFSIICIIPVDITSRACDIEQQLNCESSIVYIDNGVLKIIWNIIYWSSFILMWTFIPYFMCYAFAGDFNILERCRTSIRRNVIFYLSVGIVGVGFLALYLIFSRDSDWYGICIAASNAYGLLMMIVLLGNGIVDVPYKILQRITLPLLRKVKMIEFYKYTQKYDEAKTEYLGYVSEIKQYDRTIKTTDPLRNYVDRLVNKVNDDLASVVPTGDATKSVKNMVRINEGLIDVEWRYKQFIFLKEKTQNQAILYTQILNGDPHVNIIKKIYYKYILVLLFSEMTIPISKIDLSPYSYFIHYISDSPRLEFVFSYLPLLLSMAYSYYSLLTIQFISFLRILPNRLTDYYSLLFAAAYLCRISSPLALNTLQLIDFDVAHYSKKL
ncbi:LMBR1 domain containing protein [Entamoeba marina]